MSILSTISLLSSGVGFFPSVPSQQPSLNTVPLYIIAGQSNCGRAIWNTEASVEQHALYDAAVTEVSIFNNSYDTTNFTTLQAGLNTRLINFNNASEMGPEVSLFKSFSDQGITEAYVIKCGIGNTDLFNNWKPGGSSEITFKSHVDKALQVFYNNGKKPLLKAFIWMQGENDATNLTWANAYLQNLENFFLDFDIWYQNKAYLYSLPNLFNYKKVIGRINGINDASEIHRNVVRQAQADFCADLNNNAVLIDTDSYPLRDSVHYSVTGQLQFGIDIFNQIKNI